MAPLGMRLRRDCNAMSDALEPLLVFLPPVRKRQFSLY